jgi:hypothetical protein
LLSSSVSTSGGRPGRFQKARALVSRYATALWLGAALTLPATSAYAQSAAEEAFKTFTDSWKKTGAEISNDPITYDSGSDTLTVPNFRMDSSGSVEIPIPGKFSEPATEEPAASGKQRLDYEFTYSGSFTMTGYTKVDRGLHFDDLSGIDGPRLTVEFKLNGDPFFQQDLTFSGFKVHNVTVGLLKFPAANPEHPASRLLSFLKIVKQFSIELVAADEASGTVSYTLPGDQKTKTMAKTKFVMKGYRVTDFKDGAIGEYSFDSMTQDMESPVEGITKQTASQGRTDYKGFNFGNFLALLDPGVPETGEPMPLLASAHTEDFVIDQDHADGKSVSMKLASMDATGFTVTKRDFDFLGVLDHLLSGNTPAPEQVITAVLQAYRSFSISDFRMRGFEMAVPVPEIPGGPMTLSVGEIGLSDTSSEKIGEIFISDMKTSALPNGAEFSLGKARLGDLDFAPYGPMADLIPTLIREAGKSQPDPMRIARVFTPRSISYGLENLHVVTPEAGEVTIGKLAHDFSTTAAPIPTDISARTDNASIPVDALDDAQAAAFLKSLGLENINWSDETQLHWDEATLELTLEKLMIDVQGIGRAEATMKFANVPKALFEDPQNQAQIALVSSAFVGAEISFVDAGVTTKAVQKMAQDAGVPEEAFAQALVAQAEAALQPVNDPAFTQTVSDAVSDFLSNPGTFRVVLAPVKPVPVAQIVGSMVTPQVLPGLLNVQVTSTH